MFEKFKGTKVIDDSNNKTFHIGVDKELNIYPKILLVNKKNPLDCTSYIEIIKDDTVVFFDIFSNQDKDFTTNNIKSILQLLSLSKLDVYLYNYTHKKYTEFYNYYLEITPPRLRTNFELFNHNEVLLKQIIESSGYQIHNIYEFDFDNSIFKKRYKEIDNV